MASPGGDCTNCMVAVKTAVPPPSREGCCHVQSLGLGMDVAVGVELGPAVRVAVGSGLETVKVAVGVVAAVAVAGAVGAGLGSEGVAVPVTAGKPGARGLP